jgi:hypothetical protein
MGAQTVCEATGGHGCTNHAWADGHLEALVMQSIIISEQEKTRRRPVCSSRPSPVSPDRLLIAAALST